MEVPRAGTKEGKRNPNRRPSSATRMPETPQTEASLQWVTARVPLDIVRDIEAYAKGSGTTRSEAIRECLAVGLDTIRHRDGVPGGRVEELLGAIEGVRLLLELLGPPTFGTQRLLAHWASRDQRSRVSRIAPFLSPLVYLRRDLAPHLGLDTPGWLPGVRRP